MCTGVGDRVPPLMQTTRKSTPSANEAINTQQNTDFRIGFGLNSGQRWNGFLDEVRISSTDRSADWIAASWRSQDGTFAFTNFDSEETAPADTTPPSITARTSRDNDGNGQIDRIERTFDENVDDATANPGPFRRQRLHRHWNRYGQRGRRQPSIPDVDRARLPRHRRQAGRDLYTLKIPLVVTVAVTDGRVVPQGQSRWSTPKIRPVRLQCRSQAFDILGRSSTDDIEVLGQDDWNE